MWLQGTGLLIQEVSNPPVPSLKLSFCLQFLFPKLCVDHFPFLPAVPAAASGAQRGAQKWGITESKAAAEITAQGPGEEWGEASESPLWKVILSGIETGLQHGKFRKLRTIPAV